MATLNLPSRQWGDLHLHLEACVWCACVCVCVRTHVCVHNLCIWMWIQTHIALCGSQSATLGAAPHLCFGRVFCLPLHTWGWLAHALPGIPLFPPPMSLEECCNYRCVHVCLFLTSGDLCLHTWQSFNHWNISPFLTDGGFPLKRTYKLEKPGFSAMCWFHAALYAVVATVLS